MMPAVSIDNQAAVCCHFFGQEAVNDVFSTIFLFEMW